MRRGHKERAVRCAPGFAGSSGQAKWREQRWISRQTWASSLSHELRSQNSGWP